MRHHHHSAYATQLSMANLPLPCYRLLLPAEVRRHTDRAMASGIAAPAPLPILLYACVWWVVGGVVLWQGLMAGEAVVGRVGVRGDAVWWCGQQQG